MFDNYSKSSLPHLDNAGSVSGAKELHESETSAPILGDSFLVVSASDPLLRGYTYRGDVDLRRNSVMSCPDLVAFRKVGEGFILLSIVTQGQLTSAK